MEEDVSLIFEQLRNEKDVFQKARLIKFLQIDKNIPLKKIGTEINMKPSYLCHLLRLLRLPDLVVDGYYSKVISISHLFIISRLRDQKDMSDLYEKILSDNLTVAATESQVREKLYKIKSEGTFLTQDERQEFTDNIKKNNGFDIKIIQTRTKGKAVLEVRGSLLETTKALKEFMSVLKTWRGSGK
jgi:hypothetical protein